MSTADEALGQRSRRVAARSPRLRGALDVERLRRVGEGEAGAAEGVPDALADERVGVVVLGVVVEPVLDFVVDGEVAEVAHAHDGRDLAA